jgi:PAS domain S-box-containing protein
LKKNDDTESQRLIDNLKQRVAELEKALGEYGRPEGQLNPLFLETRLSLIRYASDHTLEALLTRALDEVGVFVESPVGFYHFVEPDQKTLSLQAWSTRTKKEFCRAEGAGLHYDIEQAGVWVDCVKTKKPVIHNDYASLPHKKGVPEGHAPVIRELVAPVTRDGRIVAILGVGNKPTDYTQHDVNVVSFFADVTWEIINRKRAEEELQHSRDMLRTVIDTVPAAIVGLDLEGNVQSVWNRAAEKMFGWKALEVMRRPLPTIPPEDRENFRTFREETRSGLTRDGLEGPIRRRDGSLTQCSIHATPLCGRDGSIIGDIAVLMDITDKKMVEQERLARLKHFEIMDRINRALQVSNDPEQVMGEVLDEVLQVFDCDRAFLMYPCDPDSQTWHSPMERNKPEYPGVLELNMEMPMDPQVAGTLRILLTADGPVEFGPNALHAQPEEISKRFGIKCLMSMAIYPKTGSPWQFGIHQCSHVRTWTAEEKRLFQEIGRRLADWLTGLLIHRDLRKNEDFLNQVVENIPDMIFVKEAETLKFVRFNRAGEKLLGYAREELLGKNEYDLFPKETADLLTERDLEVLDSKALLDIPAETIRNRKNKERILRTKKIPILDETGRPQYLLGISEDITERRRLDESIRKLSKAVDQSPVSIVITDTSGAIEFVNSKFTEITGYSRAEATGRNPRILKSGETPPDAYRRLWRNISSGKVWKGEFRNRKKDGTLFWEHATIAPIRDSDNTITHYVGIKEDITERKQLEEQFRQAQKMDSVGRLAGGVAHDFNNLLGVIMGNSELALEMAEPGHPMVAHIQEIKRAAVHSADLTRQLLAFARKQTISPRLLDLNTTVEKMLKMLKRLIGENIHLSWQPAAKILPVKIDPSQVDQILANLCVNARDAISNVGNITIETDRISLDEDYCSVHAGFRPGDYVLLTVCDNGCGMDREILDKIFEPFFTTKGSGKGTGLGLATIYGIVKQNSGFINVYSEPGQGTSFKIYLPRHEAEEGQLQTEQRTSSVMRGNETILLVEDEPAILEMAVAILSRLGYRVLPASSPTGAIRVAREHDEKIHLLVTDVVMPEMNGRDLAGEIKTIHPEVEWLFMSGYTQNVIVHNGVLDEGFNFIEKPFSVEGLSTKIREVLDKV